MDVHCHIDDEAFDADRDEVVGRARDVLILNAGVDPASNRKTIEISQTYGNVKACLGLHPEFIAKFTEDLIEKEVKWIRSHERQIVALSEIGLDYYWVKEEQQREREKALFRKMLGLADELNLPVIVHSRDAVNDTLAILQDFPQLRAVLHGYSMPENKGHLVSVAPNIYRNKAKQKQVKELPMGMLLTETDSPLLGVDPKERNEPINVERVIDKISEIKGIEKEEAANVIYENAVKLLSDRISF